MFESEGVPAYPPRHTTWQFPPPPVPTRWKWIAVLAGLLGLVGGGALLTTLIVLGDKDLPGVIDDERLTQTVALQCSLMTQTVESMPTDGSPERRAATIADQNRAIELMVEAIREDRADEIRDDRPAEQWLRDWGRLVEARESYARQLLRDPNASLDLPVDGDGDDITERMDDVWLSSSPCDVPDVLAQSGAGSRSAV